MFKNNRPRKFLLILFAVSMQVQAGVNRFDHKSGNFVEFFGAQIYYEEIGRKEDPVLLLLHGGGQNMELFNDLLAVLPDDLGYRIIAIDNRGHGKSTMGQGDLAYSSFQEEVYYILKFLGVDKLSIVGFSNGGTIGYRLAAFTDLKINKLVTICSPWNTKHRQHMIPAIKKLKASDWQKMSPKYYEIYLRENAEVDVDYYVQQAISLAVDEGSIHRPGDAVAKISCNVLAIRADADPFLSEEHFVELRGLIKNLKTVTIADSGHHVIEEQPEKLAAELVDFLNMDSNN